jgi:cell division protein ZapA (FtsZ GTPase activity inhibitor)
MVEARRVELTLLGTTVTLRTEATPEYLHSLVRYLEDAVAHLREAGVRDDVTALKLAALDLADELFREREDKQRAGDVGARLSALVSLLDKSTGTGRSKT